MFNKVAVANRGTIAARLVRALAGLGVASHVLCSEADRDNPYVEAADGFTVLGAPPPKESYLNRERVAEAALAAGCDAVHPGYGFLAEDAAFAELCRAKGLKFIGPSAKWLRVMGDKVASRDIMREKGFALCPSTGILRGTPEDMARECGELGFPLLIKPAGGGGGIGMVPVSAPEKLPSALEAAASQAERGFGRRELYAERLLVSPRHVEFQIASDGTAARHLRERDCSVQRRRQKVVEEAGAPGVHPDILEAMAARAAEVMAEVGYDHLGTVETLYSPETGFCFLEVNPRLQVEHAVTEEATGTDLVELQVKLASGLGIPELLPASPELGRHAVECRIYAEDSLRFLPSPGPLKVFRPPKGESVRVETGFREGGAVTPFYDPMIAQVITSAPDRLGALDLMFDALGDFRIEGVKTNIGFLRALMKHGPFREGRVHTTMAEELVKAKGYEPIP
ncbi:MAG: biotin carboxylase [Deltaproteobacteria bacterium]|jgi:acetyl-CoA carboxylase biotin carboxylase subunit|nr:biotin carboxylase [Deltaproteobacteria bacterium]